MTCNLEQATCPDLSLYLPHANAAIIWHTETERCGRVVNITASFKKVSGSYLSPETGYDDLGI
jgi:hypothetical protein